MVIIITLLVVSLLLAILPPIIWGNRYGKKYISGDLLPLRKKYRLYSSFGFILFTVCLLTLIEILNLIDDSYILLWVILPSFIMSRNRLFFEPYHTADIVDKLDDFCLYLRPFDLSFKNKGYWAKRIANIIPEPLEKLLCGEFNKRLSKTYCIGDPNTSIPTTLSTSGIYASDAEWQNAIETMAKNSKVILLRVMDTDGCKWELNHCINQHLNKTIFLIAEEKNLDLLNEYINATDIELPNVSIQNDSCIAIYINEKSKKWDAVVLKNIFAIRKLSDNFLKTHSEIKQKPGILESLKLPFQKVKVSSIWAHWLSIIFQPIWYILFNNWPKVWQTIFYTSFIILWGGGLYAFLITDNILWFGGGVVISLLIWLCLAPRVSAQFNNWGSEYLLRTGNISLCKWILLFGLLNTIVSSCIEFSKSNIDHAEELAKNILVDEYGYEEYSSLETMVDSLYNSVYTDKNIIINTWGYYEALNSNDEAKMAECLDGFCNSIEHVFTSDESQILGWAITHRYQYLLPNGEYQESQCIILTYGDFEEYIILSLDENDQFCNFYETINLIEQLGVYTGQLVIDESE